jgi:hypothetical protein
VLFGGRDATQRWLDDTWEWDGTTWTRHMITGPSARFGHGMAYDSARAVTVLCGGVAGETDTWEWDGATWTQRMIIGPSIVDGELSMSYDSDRKVMVLMTTFGQVWELGPSCRADFDANWNVDTRDILAFLNAWNAGDPASDCDANGVIDIRDVICFLNRWTAGC